MNTCLSWSCLAILLAASAAASADSARITKEDVPLREQPVEGSALALLELGTQVQVEAQQGMWLHVVHEGSEGWIRLTEAVRGDLPGQAGGLATLSAVARGADGPGQVAGIRGLTADELVGAEFNEAELLRLEALAVDADAALVFAEENELVSRDAKPPRERRGFFRRSR